MKTIATLPNTRILPLFMVILCFAAAGCARIRPPRGAESTQLTLTATGYCKCGKCCGWRRTWYGRPVYSYGKSEGKRKVVGLTASGVYARHGTIAADTRRYPFGTVIYVEGYGYGRVEDRGGSIKGDHIDLYFQSHRQALQWGKRKVKAVIWKPKK